MAQRPCRQCGQEIVGRDRRAVFCSLGCKERFHLDKAKAESLERRAGRFCAECGKPLAADGSGKARTCSRECGVAYQNRVRQERRRGAWEASEPKCERCAEPIPTSRRIGSKFCSWECKHLAQSAKWRAKSPGYMRNYLYGLTSEQYDAMLAEQGNRCAICGTDEPSGKGWHVDHDHAGGAVRGPLCHGCNTGLGQFKDDPAHLRAAARYLERRS